MTDLQKNLRHLLAFYGHPGIDLDQAVADVEGAVKEAGYVLEPVGLRRFTKDNEPVHELWLYNNHYMTGRGWYNKLEDELMGATDGYDEDAEESYLFADTVIEAAKKAAGLK